MICPHAVEFRMSSTFKAGKNHPKRIDKAKRFIEICELDLGTLRVTGTEIRLGDRSRQLVELTCLACNETRDYLVDNLTGRKTKSCKCQRAKKYFDPRAKMLGERFDAIKQRCRNFRSSNYRNYGDIGIECRFTRENFISYMILSFPDTDFIDLDIDRIDNFGHYEIGNLRVVSRAQNLRNKSTNKYVDYKGVRFVAADLYAALKADFPDFQLSKDTTAKLAAKGVPWSDILKRKPRSGTSVK
jgi:hypothetical protein